MGAAGDSDVSGAAMTGEAPHEFLARVVETALSRGALAAEAVWGEGEERSFRVCDDELESSSASVLQMAGVRILDSGHRQGVASLSDLDSEAADELCDAAFANARFNAPEDDVIFAGEQPQLPETDLKVYDEALRNWSVDEQTERIFEQSRRARQMDSRITSVRSSSVSSGWGLSLYLNSNGVSAENVATTGSLGLTLLGEDGGETEINGAYDSARSLEDLRKLSLEDEAVANTLRTMHGKPVPSGRYTLVLEPALTVAFLGAISELFSAVDVYQGMSLFKDKMNCAVAGACVTLIDDGRIPGRMGTAYCDSEMIPTQKTVLVERGTLCSWLTNLQYGKRLGLKSTGNAVRSLSSLPDVDVTNFYIHPGTRSYKDIVAAHDGCLCVTELMGLHTIDTLTGDFSLGARGLLNKGGLMIPVSSVTVAGNLLDFLKNITEVGSDLRFFDRFGGCTLVVDDVAVAGA